MILSGPVDTAGVQLFFFFTIPLVVRGGGYYCQSLAGAVVVAPSNLNAVADVVSQAQRPGRGSLRSKPVGRPQTRLLLLPTAQVAGTALLVVYSAGEMVRWVSGRDCVDVGVSVGRGRAAGGCEGEQWQVRRGRESESAASTGPVIWRAKMAALRCAILCYSDYSAARPASMV
jgi:hypothetical protein